MTDAEADVTPPTEPKIVASDGKPFVIFNPDHQNERVQVEVSRNGRVVRSSPIRLVQIEVWLFARVSLIL